jgi:hypothetical protein
VTTREIADLLIGVLGAVVLVLVIATCLVSRRPPGDEE